MEIGLNGLNIIELITNLQVGHWTEKAWSQLTVLIKACNQVIAVNFFNGTDGMLSWRALTCLKNDTLAADWPIQWTDSNPPQ